MTKLLRNLHSTDRVNSSNDKSESHFRSNSNVHGLSLQFNQSQSSAESTMSRYQGNTMPAQGILDNTKQHSVSKVETRLCESTGQQHPYDRENNYLSRFPLGFRGCYNCGKSDHFSTKNCP